jgi:phenylacetate-coenzyme A ligase PaaK-like adenylate-forming protein
MNLFQGVKYFYFKNIYFKKYIKMVHHNRYAAAECQEIVFNHLIAKAANTEFGKEHCFRQIKTYNDFRNKVPIRTYEQMLPYTERIFKGTKDVLWPGSPEWFAKSSGTTGSPKYLPVTANHLNCTQFAARYMIANLVDQFGSTDFIGGKVYYQADPQVFELKNGFNCASISAIKSAGMPRWAKLFALPGEKVNSIPDLNEKLKRTIEALLQQPVKAAVALPVWLSQLLIEMEKTTGKKFKEHFPLFKILFLSGMNYEPYENFIREQMGGDIFLMENYTATEGNFAYQCLPGKKGMELICNQGIFYEFIALDNEGMMEAERIRLDQVELNKQYVMVISNTSGLWAYRMNDVISFVSVAPYRLCVTGRLGEIFSPFGEHVMPLQAERALAAACKITNTSMVDFTILPGFDYENGHHYICYIEFETAEADVKSFAEILHRALAEENSYYDEFKRAGILLTPEIIFLKKGFFKSYYKAKTVQHKIRHLIKEPELISCFKNFHKNY